MANSSSKSDLCCSGDRFLPRVIHKSQKPRSDTASSRANARYTRSYGQISPNYMYEGTEKYDVDNSYKVFQKPGHLELAVRVQNHRMSTNGGYEFVDTSYNPIQQSSLTRYNTGSSQRKGVNGCRIKKEKTVRGLMRPRRGLSGSVQKREDIVSASDSLLRAPRNVLRTLKMENNELPTANIESLTDSYESSHYRQASHFKVTGKALGVKHESLKTGSAAIRLRGGKERETKSSELKPSMARLMDRIRLERQTISPEENMMDLQLIIQQHQVNKLLLKRRTKRCRNKVALQETVQKKFVKEKKAINKSIEVPSCRFRICVRKKPIMRAAKKEKMCITTPNVVLPANSQLSRI